MSQLTREATKDLEILTALTKVVGIDPQVYIQTSYTNIIYTHTHSLNY
jgi:hypothetical protein